MKGQRFILAAVLGVVTLCMFWPATRFDFIDLDDEAYVTANPFVQQGVTSQSLTWAFMARNEGYWLPLTWISFMLDREFQGAGPRGFHTTNIVLHAANTVLFFLLLCRLTGATWRSAFAAAIFALHPLRVEAVAWIAQRKDVLSSLFLLLALLAYARTSSRWRMPVVFLLMACGLMAKPMLVTLPLVLLLLDYWPLCRSEALSWRNLVLEKTPLFLLAAAFAALTVWTNRAEGSLVSLATSPLPMRLGLAAITGVEYIGKIVWPVNLAVRYPPAVTVPWLGASTAAAALAGMSFAAWRCRRTAPALFTGWFWFLVTLVPVIGLVRVGQSYMADRFTYVPAMGVSLMLGFCLPGMVRGWRVCVALGCALVVASGAATVRELGYWRNSVVLFQRALSVTTGNYAVWNSLGRAQERAGREGDAVACYNEALAIAPNFAQAHLNMANICIEHREFDAAIQHLAKGREVAPENARLLSNLGVALFQAGRQDEGVAQMREALGRNPHLLDARFNLAQMLLGQGRTNEAQAELTEIVRQNPGDTQARALLGELPAPQHQQQ